ncbi:MAG: LEA type 2 family protein [Treponema sp.]|jgi:LEA14-like dessication related protein|nr:LEA type 2 family protein [Treponema sp.]
MKKFLFLISIILIFAACKSKPEALPEIQPEEPEFTIEVLEPKFEIVSIVIIRAELINTQFEAVLKIDNPNNFSLELSSLKYQLYGNGFCWAEGVENIVLQILPESFSETKFRFTMNFIDTNRRLLDDVIAMRQVQYRFKGEVEVQAVIAGIEPFTMDFDISGLSDVKSKAE